MRVDPNDSAHHEATGVADEFSQEEVLLARVLLRRLRFLETKVRDDMRSPNPGSNGGVVFAEREAAALEWALTEIGFLADKTG